MGIMWRGIHKFQHLEIAPGGTFKGYGNVDPNGRVYYVNNITGTSGATGLSWKDPFDQVSTAITASETFRQLGERASSSVSTNDYIRNTIVVQATATAYTAVSALPNYCDIIGLGATPRGNGGGIARIDGSGANAMAGEARGLGLYNMQLMQSSAVSFYGLDLAVCYRSTFEDMGFVNNGSGGIRVVQGGSIVMNNVFCGHDTFEQLYGLEVAGGANFNSCKITNSDFAGETAGVLVSNTSLKETIFMDCAAYGGIYGFQDTVGSGQAANRHGARYIRCYGYGSASSNKNDGGFKITYEEALKAIDCYSNSSGTVYYYPATPS